MFVSLLTGIPLKAYFGGLHTADVLGLKAPPDSDQGLCPRIPMGALSQTAL